MTPSEYERVVADIVQGICAAAPELKGLTLGFGRNNRHAGASGYRHQIDVSLTGERHIYLIECKRWEAKIGVEEVMVLAARGTDIAQAHDNVTLHAVLASKVGATRGAITLAQHFRIQLETVRSAQEFGFRIGKNARVGVVDRLVITDYACAHIVE